jgi:serine phosphatase RsbU (regulator of sigma subunit)/anti-sigma regulatory factor (Ser/Thr protein kinase)
MTFRFRAHKDLEPRERSVGEARWFVRETLDAWGVGNLKDPAVLAVSELVTNAVLHAGTATEVTLEIADGALRIAVADSRSDRALPVQPAPPSDEEEHGRGLLITSTLADKWGVEYAGPTKTVWLSLGLEGTPGAAAADTVSDERAEVGAGSGDTASPPAPAAPRRQEGVGLRDEALARLGLDDYLRLAVEHARDLVAADATYLMLARDFDLQYEVTALSGLDDSLRGSRWDSRTAGTPDPRNPHLPVVVPDLSVTPVPLLEGTPLRSLVVVPVTVDGRVTGALAAASERVGGLGEDLAARLQQVADTMAVAAERARLQVAERERRGWLSFLAEAGDLLAGSLDQRMSMAITAQIVVPRLARWCAVYLDDERASPVLQQVWHHDEGLNDALREALGSSPPETLRDLDTPLLAGEPLVVPLIARGQRIGTIVLGREPGGPPSAEILLVIGSVTRRAALAIDNARAHGELRTVGAALQRSLLPPVMPEVPGLDVGVVYEAAGEASTVGGDFYDLFPVGGGRWCFAVGDVCGTGAEAAAVTGLARHTLRALAMAGFPIADILERLNAAILDEGERSRFLTLVCGVLEPRPGGGHLMTLVNAGHPPPFLVRPAGEVRQLGRPQSLLGVLDSVGYTAEQHVLSRGDLLVAVTDGVLERREGDRMLEESGLGEALRHVGGLSAQAVAERIRRLVLDFAPTPQMDDMAVLAIRLDGG